MKNHILVWGSTPRSTSCKPAALPTEQPSLCEQSANSPASRTSRSLHTSWFYQLGCLRSAHGSLVAKLVEQQACNPLIRRLKRKRVRVFLWIWVFVVCILKTIFIGLAYLFRIKLAYSAVTIEVHMVTGIVALASCQSWITLLGCEPWLVLLAGLLELHS